MKGSKGKTVVSIVGARPQFIKLARLSPVLKRVCRHLIIHTGQHYDSTMSSVFWKQLRIPSAQTNLNIGGGSHGRMTARMLIAIERELVRLNPRLVIVYGDTNSTLAGALAASKLKIPVAHVEAGLRSGVSEMPEEINRKLTDVVSRLLFCPTEISMKNLRREGIRLGVHHTGDLMYELLYDCLPAVKKNGRFLSEFGIDKVPYCYLTVHRAASVDTRENLARIIDVMKRLDRMILFPVHPRTRRRLREFGLLRELTCSRNVRITQPLGYLDSLTAAANAEAVMTDSGGLQKEAIFLGRPVLTLRDETEWTETLRQGNRLVGFDEGRILRSLSRPPVVRKPYWRPDGIRPSKRIADLTSDFLRHA